ncbi:MAG: hypothetical protein ACHQHN_02505 [Sphingobacteriales bacterium]
MRWEYKLVFAGIFAIFLIDTVGSIASRLLDFNYVYFTPASFLVYGTVGFIGTRKKNLKKGLLLALPVASFDPLIGWQISILLHANTGRFNNDEPSLVLWIFTVITMVIINTFIGLIGCGIATLLKKRAL